MKLYLCVLLFVGVALVVGQNSTDPNISDEEEEVSEEVPLFNLQEELRQIKTSCRAAKRQTKLQNEQLATIIEMLNSTSKSGCAPRKDSHEDDADDVTEYGHNCADLLKKGFTESGVYTIKPSDSPFKTGKPLQVYCDMDTDGGGWTVFQRRKDGSQNFYLGWNQYATGFGDLENEFWLGNHAMHLLTSQTQNEMRIDMEDASETKKYAVYSNFYVGSEGAQFRLTVSGYSGDAGDSMTYHNGQRFSTLDQDNDVYGTSCAQKFKGAWWYKACHYSNLNGLYRNGAHRSFYADGVNWRTWLGYYYSIQFTEMKFRPKVLV